MIATLRRLLPADQRRRAGVYVALTLLSVVIRAAGIVLLVPLVGALFSDTPPMRWAGWVHSPRPPPPGGSSTPPPPAADSNSDSPR